MANTEPSISHSASEKVSTQKISSLEEPTWVFKTGMSRGQYHDRQDLGMVLNAGATIKIRKSSTSDGYKTLGFSLLGNNKKKEKSVALTNEWQTIKIEASSVPFIDTPYGRAEAEVQYEIEGQTSKLPVYSKGSNEKSFFNEWDTSNAAFGLVKSDKFQLLMPVEDKNTAKKIPDFASLDDFIVYVNSIIIYYDNLMGLSSTKGVNKTPQNRFFIKGDGDSPAGVGAYYGDSYIANGSLTISALLPKWGWAMLHEIGHAYQPHYNSKGMDTGEVSNNLLAILFTYGYRGKAVADAKSWIYDENKESIESSLYEALVNKHQGYEVLDHRQRLILLTNLTQSVGKENWTKLNIAYREAVNTGDTKIQSMSLPDLLTWFFSTQTKKDYSPVFNQWGLSLTSTRQPTINRANEYPAVASLIDVVPKERLADAVTMLSQRLYVDSRFYLVTNQDIAALTLPGGALALHIVIDDFDQIKGKTLHVKNGQEVVKKVTIVSQDIIIPELKNGVYTLIFPETDIHYTISNYYGYVRDVQNDAKVEFNKIRGSKLYDEIISFKGLSSDEFGTLTTNVQQQQMFFDIFKTTPHSYFEGQTYATIEVRDEFGNQVYEKKIEGTRVQTEKIRLALKENYTIKLYHAETKDRLTATAAGLIDKASTTNTLVVKNGYLINQKGTPNVSTLTFKIHAAIDELKNDPELCLIKRSPEKIEIIVAILLLSEKQRNRLLEKYQDILDLRPETNVVQYLDEQGVVLVPPLVQNGRFGERRIIQAKKIAGYNIVGEKDSVELLCGLVPQNHSFIYAKQAKCGDSSIATDSTKQPTTTFTCETMTNITTNSSEAFITTIESSRNETTTQPTKIEIKIQINSSPR